VVAALRQRRVTTKPKENRPVENRAVFYLGFY